MRNSSLRVLRITGGGALRGGLSADSGAKVELDSANGTVPPAAVATGSRPVCIDGSVTTVLVPIFGGQPGGEACRTRLCLVASLGTTRHGGIGAEQRFRLAIGRE